MKKKSLLVLSVLLLSQTTAFSMETPPSGGGGGGGGQGDAGFNLDQLQNTIVGALVGYAAGWGLEQVGAQHITHQPGVKHLFQIATEQERAILQDHLPELCALVGALTAQKQLNVLFGITKVATVIDLLVRVRNRQFSKEDMAYIIRDITWMLEGFAPDSVRNQVPGWNRLPRG